MATSGLGTMRNVAEQPAQTVNTLTVRKKRQNCSANIGRSSPRPKVTDLPYKMDVDVSKCHTCHAKTKSISPSAASGCRQCHAKDRALNLREALKQSWQLSFGLPALFLHGCQTLQFET